MFSRLSALSVFPRAAATDLQPRVQEHALPLMSEANAGPRPCASSLVSGPGQGFGPCAAPPRIRTTPKRATVNAMKVRPSVKKICEKCKVIRRHGRVQVICTNPRHKQRQG